MGFAQYIFTIIFNRKEKHYFVVKYMMEFDVNYDREQKQEEFQTEEQLFKQFKRKYKEKIGKDFDGEIIEITEEQTKIVSI